MSEDEYRFLSLPRPHARLTVQQTAWILNCAVEDLQALAKSRLLKPLGNPPQNGKKYYSTKEVLQLAEDSAWLGKMTNAVYKKWREKNAARNGQADGALKEYSRLSQ